MKEASAESALKSEVNYNNLILFKNPPTKCYRNEHRDCGFPSVTLLSCGHFVNRCCDNFGPRNLRKEDKVGLHIKFVEFSTYMHTVKACLVCEHALFQSLSIQILSWHRPSVSGRPCESSSHFYFVLPLLQTLFWWHFLALHRLID